MTETVVDYKTQILESIGSLIDAQNEKGLQKYGVSLEDCNPADFDWDLMLIEELIDALQYQQKEIHRLRNKKGALSLRDYQIQSRRTVPLRPEMSSEEYKLCVSNYAMGLAGEAGEVVDLLKKHLHHDHTLVSSSVLNEIGDVLHYAAGLCSMLGLSLEDAANFNIRKLEKRYPNGFSKEDSINRSE